MSLRLLTPATEVQRLRAKLDTQWAWFNAHPDCEDTERNTDIFLRTLAKYERACDAAGEARTRCR
jgi:hypothetical protein